MASLPYTPALSKCARANPLERRQSSVKVVTYTHSLGKINRTTQFRGDEIKIYRGIRKKKLMKDADDSLDYDYIEHEDINKYTYINRPLPDQEGINIRSFLIL